MRRLTTKDRVIHGPAAALRRMAPVVPMCLSLAFTQAVLAQDTTGVVPPLVEVSTDKPTYRLHEPVVLTVRITNRSDRPQVYFALDPLSGYFKVRVTGPGGQRVGMYSRPAEAVSGPSQATSTAPDSSRVESLLISHFYPLTASGGVCEVQVSIHLPFEPESVQPAPVTLHLPVTASGNRQLLDEVIEPYGRAVSVVRNQQFLVNQRVLDALGLVIESPDPATDYLKEAALYYLAEANWELARLFGYRRAAQGGVHVGSGRPLDDAESGFRELGRRYPGSSFVDLAALGLDEVSRIQKSVGRRPDGQN